MRSVPWIKHLTTLASEQHSYHPIVQLEALVAKQQQEAGSLKEAELQSQLEKARAGLRDQLEKSARARKLFERCGHAGSLPKQELPWQLGSCAAYILGRHAAGEARG